MENSAANQRKWPHIDGNGPGTIHDGKPIPTICVDSRSFAAKKEFSMEEQTDVIGISVLLC